MADSATTNAAFDFKLVEGGNWLANAESKGAIHTTIAVKKFAGCAFVDVRDFYALQFNAINNGKTRMIASKTGVCLSKAEYTELVERSQTVYDRLLALNASNAKPKNDEEFFKEILSNRLTIEIVPDPSAEHPVWYMVKLTKLKTFEDGKPTSKPKVNTIKLSARVWRLITETNRNQVLQLVQKLEEK